MHFINSVLATLGVTSSIILARPVPISDLGISSPGRPEIPLSERDSPDLDSLQTVSDDIYIFTTALMRSGGEIESLLSSSPSGLPAYIVPSFNSAVNTNLKSIAAAALEAGAGVGGVLKDAAHTLTAPEAQLLKADAHLIISLASHTAAIMKKVDAAGVSATNTELPNLKAAIISAVKDIIQLFQSYVAGTTALDGSGAESEVTILKDTVAQAATSVDSLLA